MEFTLSLNLKRVLERAPLGTKFTVNEQGELHNENGPAVVFPGTSPGKQWYQNGKMHRLDGPAEETCSDHWWVDGRPISGWMQGRNHWRETICTTDEIKWRLLKANPEQIISFDRSSKEMQEYVVQVRPDLIGKIPGLWPEVRSKFKHEAELSKVDL
jgi:hypothetical protein